MQKSPEIFTVCSLEQALQFDGTDVIHRFVEHVNTPLIEAASIFEEMKKWLWLNCKAIAEGKQLKVITPISIIDEMWHTFILFTEDYEQYCLSNFGFFLHHRPPRHSDKVQYQQRHESNPDLLVAFKRKELTDQIGFTYDLLGQETAQLWYGEFSNRYSPERLAEITRG